MKRFTLIALLAIVGGAAFMELMRHDAGYILIAYGNTTIETSLWIGLVVLFVFMVAVLLLVYGMRKSALALKKGVHFLADGKAKRAGKRTNAGLIYYIEGNWQAARKELLKAAKVVDQPLVHYLAAARSAYELGDSEQTQQLLLQAEQNAPENTIAIAISQARIQLMDKKYELCLATLNRAQQQAPNHPVILDMLKNTLWQLKDWAALIKLLPKLKAVYPEAIYKTLEEDLYFNRLQGTVRSQGVDRAQDNDLVALELHDLHKCWQQLPKHLHGRQRLLDIYVWRLLQLHDYAYLNEFIPSSLKHAWYDNLVAAYAQIVDVNYQQQLAVAEAWLKKHAGNAVLLHTLGRLSVKNQLWGKAKDYLEASLRGQESPAVYADLGRLYAQLGDHKRSTELYERGLLLKTTHGHLY